MSMSAGHDVVRFSVFQALPKMPKTLRKGAAYLRRSGCPKEVFLSKLSKKVVASLKWALKPLVLLPPRGGKGAGVKKF